MTFVLLHADRLRSVVAGDALVPAADVATVRDAAALLVEAGRLRDHAEQDIADTRDAARATGFEEGRVEGRASADAATTTALATLHAAAEAREEARRADVARLALEVVRRIAGEVGAPEIVAGIADRATLSLTGDAGAVVRVAPACVDAVRDRLGDRGVGIEGDPTLDESDCVVETPLGRTHAGLETQLAAIARAWDTP